MSFVVANGEMVDKKGSISGSRDLDPPSLVWEGSSSESHRRLSTWNLLACAALSCPKERHC
jgi:hypothetical protein